MYLYSLLFHPIYDYGLILKMFMSGPTYFKNNLALDERDSFSKIQTELFIRHCAKVELLKALDTDKQKEYKPFTELILMRIIKNNVHDILNSWKKKYYKFRSKIFKPKMQ